MAGPRGYNSYRGKTPIGKIILAIVLVLVILAAVAFLLLQKYIVYDDSGKPRLELPQSQETPSSSSAEGSSSQNDDLPPIQIQEPAETAVKGILLPEQPLTTWDASVMEQGDNSVAVTMKAAGGKVYFTSDAAASGTVETAEGSAAALAALTADDDVHTIARFSCFRDSLAARADVEGMGLKNTGGYIFYDGSNQQWLDPAKPSARQYLYTMAKECADLGFDEILLTDLSYPTEGKLNKIAYGEGDKSANIKTFLTELRAVLSDTHVKLSVELPAAVLLTGSDQNAGQVLSDIAPLVDRIYTQTTADQTEAIKAALSNDSVEFVPELTAPSGDTYLVTAAD